MFNKKLYIDPEAKTSIDLIHHLDEDGNPFYTGKLQFPGTIDFGDGVSFMVFVSDSGSEQLQIGPLDHYRMNKRRGAFINNGRLTVDLHPMSDRNNKTYYVGEAIGMGSMNLRDGIFFTIFIAKSGIEMIQISKLRHKNID